MIQYPPLEPERFYHVFNRGNNREDLFREERNYAFFLERYAYHVGPVADTFAYCLLRNHFHLLVRVKAEADWPDSLPPARRFANLFNSYAKAVNKAYGRTGSLFQKRFGRIEVTSPSYFARLVCYIHQNPQRHGFVEDYRDYPHSSYHALRSPERPTRLRRDETLAWLAGPAGFAAAHGVVDLPSLGDLAGLDPIVDPDFENEMSQV